MSAAKSGYFFNDSEYARFHTEQRVGLIKGNPKELEQWCNVFIFDVYTIGAELQQDDPKNLYERLTQIKAPIFLAFGDKEPFIPTPAFNGLTDLGRDVITPFMTRMTNAGNRPMLKIYPETGHFIHTDNPVEYLRRRRGLRDQRNGRHQFSARYRSHDQGRRGIGPAGGADAARRGAHGRTEQIGPLMARVQAGEVQLGWREWGEGEVTVVFIHGNLASKDWIELAAPLFPNGLRVIGIDWRGCGESDRPTAECRLFELLHAAACRGHAGGARCARYQVLPSRDPFDRRHHRRADAADAAATFRAGVRARSGHAAWHVCSMPIRSAFFER